MRALLAGAWDEGPGYPRATSLRQGLRAAGVEVGECREQALGADKQRLVRAPWRWPGHWWRQRAARRRLLAALPAAIVRERPDFVLVPYPGHTLVRSIAAVVDVPVVLDLFLSAYDTVVEDRRLVAPGSLAARWLWQLDAGACRAADLVLVDTPENAAYLRELTGLPAERFAWLPVHDPDATALPTPWRPPRDGRLQLLFFGTGVPLHGLDTLVDAVALAPDVHLTLVGGTRADRERAVGRLGARLTLLPPFLDRSRLQEQLDACQLVAGVFGASAKAQRVVPFKVVHALAAGRPVLTADTPAVARWLDGSGAVFGAPAGDVPALAAELRALAGDVSRLAAAARVARAVYDRHFGTARLAARWRELLPRLLRDRLLGAA